MNIKTSELEGDRLDWAVAKAAEVEIDAKGYTWDDNAEICYRPYSPSTDWSQGGPLIEEYGITVTYCLYDQHGYWVANSVDTEDEDNNPLGETPLIAACRAIVASQIGEEVEIPDVLVSA